MALQSGGRDEADRGGAVPTRARSGGRARYVGTILYAVAVCEIYAVPAARAPNN